jgi:hypothetical protein
MSLSMKAIGKRFSLLAALVAALLIGCAGVLAAQSSSSTANAGYEKPIAVTGLPSDSCEESDGGPLSNDTASSSEVSVAARVPNGGFETGNFSGWSRANQRIEGGEGNWFVYSGTQSPLSGSPIAAPPRGEFAATTDQDDPGSHVLYSDIRLRAGQEHTLSFFLYYCNRADRFFTRNTLNPSLDRRNQQYRVDLLKPNTNPFTLDPDAIRAEIFRTEVGDPLTLEPTRMTFNLTPFAGQTVRLRFAEVDNQAPFQASVDQVKVKSE